MSLGRGFQNEPNDVNFIHYNQDIIAQIFGQRQIF